MRGDATFATTSMDNHASILEDLGTRNLDNLRKILDAIRLRKNPDHLKPLDDYADNDNYVKNAQQQDVVDLSKHSDDVVHADTGVFAQVYANNRLAQAHASLYPEFEASDPADVPTYIQDLGNIELVQRPCFVICTGGTAPSVTVLHGLALHKRDLETKSKHNSETFAFYEDAETRERALSVAIVPAWLKKDDFAAPMKPAFEQAIKDSPRAPTITATTLQQVSVSRTCLLPTAFAALLLDRDLSPTAAWPII